MKNPACECGVFFGPSWIAGARALGFQAGHSFAPRTSHLAHGSPSASRARRRHRSLHLGVSRGDLGAHPRCSDSPPRSDRKAAARPMCLYGLRPLTCAELASRVDTKVSHDDTVEWEESRWRGAVAGPDRCRNREPMRKRWLVPGCRARSSRLCQRACAPADDAAARFGSTHVNLRVRESLRCSPSRRVPHK
jgi:hypothetical protein